MKKIILSLLLSISSTILVYSQVAIGKSAVTNSSVSLEFGSDNRGMIVPWVSASTGVTGAVNGTVIYDITDKKVKYLKAGSWFDLSVDPTGSVDTSLQDGKTEQTTAKTVIGANSATDATPGILVLSDANKAMVLPKVASPHLNIINPAPGMMVYDTTTKQLAVFNGKVWTFWKS
jgi:hypothetical protein